MPIQSTIKAGRNDPCPCGSELKFKWCHGDQEKQKACNAVANIFMARLITEERKKRGLDPYLYTCKGCGKGFDQPVKSEISGPVPILKCPLCGNTDLQKNEVKQPEQKQKQELKPENKSSIILEG